MIGTNEFSLAKYDIFFPQRLHPIECNCASFVEYISGFIPSLYKLSGLAKFTMDILKNKIKV